MAVADDSDVSSTTPEQLAAAREVILATTHRMHVASNLNTRDALTPFNIMAWLHNPSFFVFAFSSGWISDKMHLE